MYTLHNSFYNFFFRKLFIKTYYNIANNIQFNLQIHIFNKNFFLIRLNQKLCTDVHRARYNI